MFHDGFALVASHPVDRGVLIDRVIILMGRRDFLDDAALVGAELMPCAGKYHRGVAGYHAPLLAVDLEEDFPPQHLEGLLLQFVIVVGVRLSGKLNQNLLAIVTVDAVDEDAAGPAEIRYPIMVGILYIEFSAELDPGNVQDRLHLVDIAFESLSVAQLGQAHTSLHDRRVARDLRFNHDSAPKSAAVELA